MPKTDEKIHPLTQAAEDAPYTKAISSAAAKPGQTMLFYNPGSRFTDIVRYDSPWRLQREKGIPEVVQGMQSISAEERGFFEVPASLTIINEETGAEDTASIGGMYARIMQQYRERGVVLVEADPHKSRAVDPNVAPTKAEAMEKGDELHREFVRAKVNEWIRIVEDVRAQNGVPMPATGLYKECLKKLHMADPADRVETLEHERKGIASAKESDGKIANLEAQLAELKSLLMARNTQPGVGA